MQTSNQENQPEFSDKRILSPTNAFPVRERSVRIDLKTDMPTLNKLLRAYKEKKELERQRERNKKEAEINARITSCEEKLKRNKMPTGETEGSKLRKTESDKKIESHIRILKLTKEKFSSL